MKSLSFTRRCWNIKTSVKCGRHFALICPLNLCSEERPRAENAACFILYFALSFNLNLLYWLLVKVFSQYFSPKRDLFWVWRIYYSCNVDCSSEIKFHTLSGLDWCWYSSFFLVFHWNGNHDRIRKLQQVQEQLLQVHEYFVAINNLFYFVFNSSRSYVIGYHF